MQNDKLGCQGRQPSRENNSSTSRISREAAKNAQETIFNFAPSRLRVRQDRELLSFDAEAQRQRKARAVWPFSAFSLHLCASAPKLGALLPVAILMLWLAACGGSATPQALRFGPAPWQSGERHTLAITTADGQPGGVVTYLLTAGADETGAPEWVLERSVNSLGLEEFITVKMSEAGFRPQSAYLERSDREGAESVDAQYNGGQVDMELTTKRNVTTVQRVSVPSDARDMVTMPMILRGLPLARGYATQANLFLPIAAQLERVTVRVTGEEEITVPAGTFSTWAVDVDSAGTVSKLWFAQAAPHQLIKYQDGRNKAVFELSDYQAEE